MKNNKGITLTSLVVYIAVIIVVTATVIRVTTYFKNNMEDVADVSFETEFQKINLYLLTECKTTGNSIEEITGDKTITFTNGNKYQYSFLDKAIYLNDTIKICEGVEKCKFSQKTTDNGKIAVILEIKIAETSEKKEYVISNIKTESIINETDYVWNTIENNTTT